MGKIAKTRKLREMIQPAENQLPRDVLNGKLTTDVPKRPLQGEAEIMVSEICDSILHRLNKPEQPAATKNTGGPSLTQTPNELEPIAQTVDTVDSTTREWLIQQLRGVLEIAMDRVTHRKTPPADRIKWPRIVIAAGQACNSILRDVDIEALKQQIQDLKQLTEERLGDEQGIDQEEHPTTPKED